MAPDWTWLLQHIESEDGYVRFPPLFSRIITNLKIENYPELYENEAFIGAMMLRAFMSPEEIKVLNAELEALSPEDRAKFIDASIRDLNAVGDNISFPKTIGEQRRAEAAFNALSEAEKKEVTQFWQYFIKKIHWSF